MNKLKAAMKEIENVLKKHDLMGILYLADGEEKAEYRYHITEATWSQLEWKKDKSGSMMGIHVKAYGKTEYKKTNMTVNAAFCLCDLHLTGLRVIRMLNEAMDENLDIEHGKGVWGE